MTHAQINGILAAGGRVARLALLKITMSQAVSIDAQKIKNAVKLGLPVTVATSAFPRKVVAYVDMVLASFLQELRHPEMQDFLSYMINELATNAKKANTKRVYFMQKGFDVNNEDDYKKGMLTFKADTLEDIQHYLQLQKEAGLYIKIVMQYASGNFMVEVRNNSEMTKTEFKRIFDKIARAQKYSALEDVLPEVFDETEGAGLGLIISLIMLRKIGMPPENFVVLVEGGETIVRATVPVLDAAPAAISGFSRQVADYIETMPKFPDNIVRIERMLADPDVDMLDIATIIASDVSLSTDLLRIVNSAAYGLKQKVVNIPYAVNLVGTRGIRNLLYSIGVMNILGAKTDDSQSDLWDVSYKAAFYASWLARNKVRKAALNDLAYVCGLLHRIGKIVLSLVYTSSDLQEKMQKLKEQRNIPGHVFDMLTSEVNHPEIGAALAEKWNFPPAIVSAIRFQHDYERAPEEHRELAGLISLVDILLCYKDGEVQFSQVKPELLKMVSISNEKQFEDLCDSLETEFTAEHKRELEDESEEANSEEST